MSTKKPPLQLWLFKEEPTHYSYSQLEADGKTVWDGVDNALARKHLRSVNIGDRVLYYHTGSEKAIVGEMCVTSAPRPDPNADEKSVVVDVKPIKSWLNAVSLTQIKADAFFASWDLVRNSRLSVVPVTKEQWQRLEALRDQKTPAD